MAGRGALRQRTWLRLEGEPGRGKIFSQNRSNFPWTRGRTRGLGEQRTREFEPDQMVAIRVRHPESSGAEIACCLG